MKFLAYIIVIILICSCRMTKESRTRSYLATAHQYAQEEQHRTHLFRQQDSSNRYWMFRTDTAFYFHPDSGLYASGGRLWLQEIRHRESIGQQSYDSLVYQANEDQLMAQTMFDKWTSKGKYWGILGIVLIGMMLWWKIKRRSANLQA